MANGQPTAAQHARSAAPSKDLSLGVLAGVPFLMVLGNSMLFPIFPKMQSSLSLTGFQTSLVVTAFSVPAALLIPIAGYLSDRFGRRPVMAPGVALFGIGALIAGLAPLLFASPYSGVLIGRVLQGAGAAGMSQLAMAMAADLFPGRSRSRALGLIEATNGLGKVVSPVAGAVVGLIAWFAPFFLFAILAVPLAAAIVILTRERATKRAPKSLSAYWARVRQIFTRRGWALGSALLAGAMTLFLLFGTLFYLSEVLESRYHMAPIPTGLILAIPVAALSLASYAEGLILQKRPNLARSSVLVGLAVVGAVMGAAAVTRGLSALAAAISFMGIGGAAVLASLNLLITSSASTQERGLITSLYGAVRFFGVALGPPAFGLLLRRGEPLLFGSAAGLAVAVGLVAFWLLDPNPLLRGGDHTTRQGSGSVKRYTSKRRDRAASRLR